MIDSGCSPTGFIDADFARTHNFRTHDLPNSRTLRLADGTVAGAITQCCVITHTLGGTRERLALYVWPLDGPDVILGLPWLRLHNPSFDWAKGLMTLHGEVIQEVPSPAAPEPEMEDKAKQPRRRKRRRQRHDTETKATETPATAETSVDIRILNAPNFMLACKQKGVQVMKMRLADIYRHLPDDDGPVDERFADELAASVPSETLRAILLGSAPASQNLGPRLSAFQDWIAEAPFLRAVSEEDIQKYLDGKEPLTEDEIRKRLPKEYHDLIKGFLPSEADVLPPHRPFDHKIELIPGAMPPHLRSRPMSQPELRAIRKYLDEHLAKGFIRASTSPAAAPILIARKPGGGIRICVDYRGLNNITVKNRYPIPLIRETLDALTRAKFFTKLDITAAFNRLRIAPGDEWKTAFITRFGLFECLVANFGMTGAPSSFQHYINHTLFDILDKYVTAYLDDILIYSKSRGEHRRHVREVLKRLTDAGLTIDIRKCEFSVTETKYLGLIISTSGIRMDQEKVRAITTWELPKSLKDLQRFLGFANFYRRFIAGFSGIARPLTNLLGKGNWVHPLPVAAAEAFEALKRAFVTAPVLSYFHPERRTVVEVDASDWAAGGVLSQYDEAGILHPVAFFSAKHTPAECNYEIYDKELLAIVKAFEEWRPELQGVQDPAEVVTDHKSLQHFTTTKLLNQRQVRWSEFLSDFRFQIVYRPGAKATIPDALSRLPGARPENTTNTADDRVAHRSRILLPPDRWATPPVTLLALDAKESIDVLIDRAYAASGTANTVIQAISAGHRRLPQAARRELRAALSDCSVVRGRIYVRDRIWVPEEPELRLEILHRTHSSAPGGHPGRFKTYDLMRRTYYWPRLSRDVGMFVRGCHSCSRTKGSRQAPAGFLDPLPVPFRPWSDISVDYVGPLPPCEVRGNRYEHVLVVVDRLTKMRHFIPVVDVSAEHLADAFVAEVYRLHGTPAFIVSDRGPQFVSTFWKELSRCLGVTLRASTAFHPETDGQTEVVNSGLEQYLRTFCSFFQDDWVRWLPLGEFAANNHVSETTGLSPFFANYGWHPAMGTEPVQEPVPAMTRHQQREFLNATAAAERIERVTARAKAFMAEAQERYAHYADASRVDAITYSVGDRVWINTANIRTGRPMHKLDDKWKGPFRVTKVYRRAVVVELPPEFKIFPVFHVALVKPYEPGLPGQESLNAEADKRAEGIVLTNSGESEEDEEGEMWYFDKILNSRKVRGTLQYRIKWPHPHKPTWEPAENLKGCDEEIQKFHDANPKKPGPPAWFQTGGSE